MSLLVGSEGSDFGFNDHFGLLETTFIRSLHREGSVRMEKLKRLNEAFAWKIEDHDLLNGVELENLEAEQLAAMNEEKQKAEQWLSLAKGGCYSEPSDVNLPPLIDSRSNDNAGVSQLAINTTIDATSVASESTRQLEDQNPGESESTRQLEDQYPSESVYAGGNASALTNISISAPANTTESPVEVTETAPNENVAQDKINSSSAELTNHSELHDSQVEVPDLEPVDTITSVQSNDELEEDEIQEEFELEEGEIQEEEAAPTIGSAWPDYYNGVAMGDGPLVSCTDKFEFSSF